MSLTRRTGLALGLAGLAAPALLRAQEGGKARFCLLHGAWFGGWAWEPVAIRLRARGHAVTTPTLPGLGERRGEAQAGIGLADHGRALSDHLFMHDLSDVVLVAHALGGVVLSQVLGAGEKRITQAIYFDALVPGAGESFADSLPEPTREEIVAAAEAGELVPPSPRHAWEPLWGLAGEPAAFAEPRVSPQPPRTFLDAVEADPFTRGIPRTFLKATEAPSPVFRAAEERAAARGDFIMARLPGPHMMMLSDPDRMAETLVSLVR